MFVVVVGITDVASVVEYLVRIWKKISIWKTTKENKKMATGSVIIDMVGGIMFGVIFEAVSNWKRKKKLKKNTPLLKWCHDGVVVMCMDVVVVVTMAYVTGGVVGIVVVMSYLISKKKELVIKQKQNKTKQNTPLLKWCCDGVVIMGMDGIVIAIVYITGGGIMSCFISKKES